MSKGSDGFFSFLLKDRIVAGPNFNRWWVPPASISIHLCIGSVYAWSVFNPPLIRELGVVVSAADDWSLSSVVWIFSVAIVALGLAASIAGKWLEEVGPRCVGVTAAFLWGGGFIIGSFGIATHQLWLVYLGYGVFGGCGLGLGYVSPVSTLNSLVSRQKRNGNWNGYNGIWWWSYDWSSIKSILIKTIL